MVGPCKRTQKLKIWLYCLANFFQAKVKSGRIWPVSFKYWQSYQLIISLSFTSKTPLLSANSSWGSSSLEKSTKWILYKYWKKNNFSLVSKGRKIATLPWSTFQELCNKSSQVITVLRRNWRIRPSAIQNRPSLFSYKMYMS